MSTLEIIKDKLKQKRALQEISSCLTGKETNQRINQKPLEKCVSYSLPTEYWFIRWIALIFLLKKRNLFVSVFYISHD